MHSNLHSNQGADASTFVLPVPTPHPPPLSRKGRGEQELALPQIAVDPRYFPHVVVLLPLLDRLLQVL